VWTLPLTAQAPKEEKIHVVRAGLLIIDPSLEPVANGRLVIREDTVIAAGPAGSVSEPSEAETIDLSEYTVLPGLIDTHTHLSVARYWSPNQPSPALGALLAIGGMKRAIEAGVTTLRVVGSLYFQDVALRDAIRRGVIDGPRVVPAAHALTVPGGHGDPYEFAYTLPLEDFYTPLYGFITSAQEAEKAVLLQVRHGAEVIKVSTSGGVGSPLDHPSQQQISDEALRVIVDTAHRMGVRVTSHAESLPSVKASLAAGVDSIDHGSELDRGAVRTMVEREIFLIPTVHVTEVERNPERTSSFVLKKAADLKEPHAAAFHLALAEGVRMAAGSDSSYSGQFTLIDELETMVKHEMSEQAALEAATVGAATALGLDKNIGSLTKGKKADLIAVRGNPLENISALEDLMFVMREGRILLSRIERKD
jgi:imidazolonepropionase-like amidohydrolase